MKSLKQFKEEVAVNNMGSGNIQKVDPILEPMVKRKKLKTDKPQQYAAS